MKKIVALALCLVLALSLCATAFALDSGVVYHYTSTTDTVGAAVATPTYVAAKDPTATKVGNIAYYDGGAKNYVVEDKADADFVLYTGTGYIYLTEANAVGYGTNPGYVLDYKKGTTAKCGQIEDLTTYDAAFTKVNGAGKTQYFMATKAANDAASATNILVDGVIYTVTGAAGATKAHTWTAVTTNATTGAVETVACTACGAKGTVVSQAVYEAAPAAQQSDRFGALYVLVAAAGTTTTTGVSSAKTFDAGIALYVGMSISAVAGSAVVIGKKKEF